MQDPPFWTLGQAPDQSGRVALVTGANAGLGFATALALAGKGAQVVLACRDMGKAAQAKAQMLAEHPGARIDRVALDTSSLAHHWSGIRFDDIHFEKR